VKPDCSQAHGAELGSTGWYGLYIPPPNKVLGLEREEHFVFIPGGKLGGNGRLTSMSVSIH